MKGRLLQWEAACTEQVVMSLVPDDGLIDLLKNETAIGTASA